MNRRSFLGNAAIGAAGTAFLSSIPAELLAITKNKGINMPLGFQSYVFRDVIGQQPEETMKRLASYGYQNVEWCSPKGYQGPFAPLAKYTGKELKKITNDSGLANNQLPFHLERNYRRYKPKLNVLNSPMS